MSKCLVLFMVLLSTNVWAAEDESSFNNFDNIVNELKTSADDQKHYNTPTIDFDWQEVAIHTGVALSTSWVSMNSPDGTSGSGLMKGLELSVGMNLFTRKLRAEGAFTNFAQEDLSHTLKASCREFELRFVYLPVSNDKMTLRLGTGVTARYMDLESQAGNHWNDYSTSTPSSIFLVGFERKISPSVSLGPDLSYRSSLISDTYDRAAMDATLRLNATF